LRRVGFVERPGGPCTAQQQQASEGRPTAGALEQRLEPRRRGRRAQWRIECAGAAGHAVGPGELPQPCRRPALLQGLPCGGTLTHAPNSGGPGCSLRARASRSLPPVHPSRTLPRGGPSGERSRAAAARALWALFCTCALRAAGAAELCVSRLLRTGDAGCSAGAVFEGFGSSQASGLRMHGLPPLSYVLLLLQAALQHNPFSHS
jgi:hypothetical protein